MRSSWNPIYYVATYVARLVSCTPARKWTKIVRGDGEALMRSGPPGEGFTASSARGQAASSPRT